MTKPKCGAYLTMEGDSLAVVDVLNGMGVSVEIRVDYMARTVSVQLQATDGPESSSWRLSETLSIDAYPLAED